MADVNRKDSCTNCLFFVEEHRNGSCKRYPESVIKGAAEWCGEFKFDSSKVKEAPTIEVTFIQAETPKSNYDITTDTMTSIVETLTTEPTPEPVKKPGRPKKVVK